MLEFSDDFFKEEEKCGFLISSEMKRAWAGELKILDAIQRLCKKHDIKYFATYGTLLGAIRHQGFIPWDDDIDIMMPRNDYMKFISVCDELGESYFVKSMYSMNYFRQFHAVVSNANAPTLEWDEKRIEEFYGCPYILGIDVNPMDYVPRDSDAKNLQKLMYHLGYSLVMDTKLEELPADYAKRLDFFESRSGFTFDTQSDSFIGDIMRVTDQFASCCKEEDADYMCYYPQMAYIGEATTFPKEWFDESVSVPFENTTIEIPANYDDLLKLYYGPDYMKPENIGGGHDYPFYKGQKEYFTYMGYM